ncbi:MAG: hypothetical protein ABL929_02165 [Ferruginibacter sp.]|nr:hypothetical protein [Ferruginibacter sp.]
MKKISTLVLLMGIIFSGYAQWQGNGNDRSQRNNGPNNTGQYGNYGTYNQNSALVVNAFTQKQFVVVVDNGYQYKSQGNTVNVGTLSMGNHNITIYENNRGVFGRERQRIIYNSILYFKPNTEMSININNYGQVNILETILAQNQNGNYGNKRKHRNRGHDDRKNDCDRHGRDDD